MLNLSFDPCFNVKWDRHTKCPYFTFIIGAMASEYKDRPSKVLAFKCFEKNFGLILKNEMAAIANYLKIINML